MEHRARAHTITISAVSPEAEPLRERLIDPIALEHTAYLHVSNQVLPSSAQHHGCRLDAVARITHAIMRCSCFPAYLSDRLFCVPQKESMFCLAFRVDAEILRRLLYLSDMSGAAGL